MSSTIPARFTAQLAAAAFGNPERIQRIRVIRERLELKLVKESNQLIDVEIARRLWQAIVTPAKEKFLAFLGEAAPRLGFV